jgi:hypothetical protein
MNNFIYPTEPEILDGLESCSNLISKANASSPHLRHPPTRDELIALLNCCFAASLETEEGRTVAFTASFCVKGESPIDYRLKQPLPMSSRDLARLAVALDPWRSRICVLPGEPSLQIAGLVHLGEQFDLPIRQVALEFSIRVLGPGVLLVIYDGNLLLTYQRGRFAFHFGELARFTTYDARGALSFTAPSLGTGDQVMEDLRFRHSLVRIARAMLNQRHGGTLLVVPQGMNWKERTRSQYEPETPATLVMEIGALSRRFAGHNEPVSKLTDNQMNLAIGWAFAPEFGRAAFPSALEWLARLTGTDGMTVILPDFTLLGFGVFFNTEEKVGAPTLAFTKDPYDETATHAPKPLNTVGGARHQSAAVTCRNLPGSLAIVASQDGTLSSMKWDAEKNGVVIYRRLELLLDV